MCTSATAIVELLSSAKLEKDTLIYPIIITPRGDISISNEDSPVIFVFL